MLHILQGTQMALQFFNEKFSLLSIEDYVDIVIRQLEVLPPDLIIERLTGDGMANDLIEPQWTIKKTIVLNEIDKEMVRRNTWQGKYYKK
jgi:radical SAM superfamily enzyme